MEEKGAEYIGETRWGEVEEWYLGTTGKRVEEPGRIGLMKTCLLAGPATHEAIFRL